MEVGNQSKTGPPIEAVGECSTGMLYLAGRNVVDFDESLFSFGARSWPPAGDSSSILPGGSCRKNQQRTDYPGEK